MRRPVKRDARPRGRAIRGILEPDMGRLLRALDFLIGP